MTSLEQYEYLRYTINLISRSKYGRLLFIKGGSALLSKMLESGFDSYFRKTTDIAIHCDKKSLWEEFCENVVVLLNENDRHYRYELISRRADTKGFQSSDSLKFKLYDNDIVFDFRMDMNIKSNSIIFVEYSTKLNMNTYDSYTTMLSDKISVISSEKIFRRIKDLYDLHVLLIMYNFELNKIWEIMAKKHKDAELVNMLTYEEYDKLNHAYERFRGIDNKPDFSYIFAIAELFLTPVYNEDRDLLWDREAQSWLDQ